MQFAFNLKKARKYALGMNLERRTLQINCSGNSALQHVKEVFPDVHIVPTLPHKVPKKSQCSNLKSRKQISNKAKNTKRPNIKINININVSFTIFLSRCSDTKKINIYIVKDFLIKQYQKTRCVVTIATRFIAAFASLNAQLLIAWLTFHFRLLFEWATVQF